MSTILTNRAANFKTDIELVSNTVEKLKNDSSKKARIAIIHSSILLMAALFEKFIREIATEYLKVNIPNSQNINKVPSDFKLALWRRTFQSINKELTKEVMNSNGVRDIIIESELKIKKLFGFLQGDLSFNIYEDLIHNEHNMTETQVNEIFKVCGIAEICKEVCEGEQINRLYSLREKQSNYHHFRTSLDRFIKLRNSVAHDFDFRFSDNAVEFYYNCEMLIAFATDLGSCLESKSENYVATSDN